MEDNQVYTVHLYLKGKVADYTVSDNVIASICFDRNVDENADASEADKSLLELCYADLLKYVYLQPSGTKSYAVANGTWSQKEGATSLTFEDKAKILALLRRIYSKYGETDMIPTARPTIRMTGRGIRMWKK